MIKRLQKKYALSEQGAKDLVKGCIAWCVPAYHLYVPVGLLFSLVGDLMGGGIPEGKGAFYAAAAGRGVGADPTIHLAPV